MNNEIEINQTKVKTYCKWKFQLVENFQNILRLSVLDVVVDGEGDALDRVFQIRLQREEVYIT